MTIQPVLWTLKFPSSPQRVNAETTYLTIREATGYAVKCSDNPLLVALYHADDVAKQDARIAELTAEVANYRHALFKIKEVNEDEGNSPGDKIYHSFSIARNALKEGGVMTNECKVEVRSSAKHAMEPATSNL